MKKILAVLLVLFIVTLCSCTKNNTTSDIPEKEDTTLSVDGKEFKLTFSDEFDSDLLDTTKWELLPEQVRDTCSWGNPDSVILSDGELKLKVQGSFQPYDAGAIRSRGLFEQAYGYYEIRCKLPSQSGINAAFWLMCDSAGAVGIPGGEDGSEIDILETHNYNNSEIQHAIHWDGYWENHQTVNHTMCIPNIYEGYHTFGFLWDADTYVFYVDGEETWRTTGGGVCFIPSYLKLTVATGGWVGDPNPLLFPTDALTVDYVRVYELAN